jgi:ATP-binding cassette subfamily B protein
MADKDFHYELSDRELAGRIWARLRPYRRRIGWALTLLVFAVPFVNFHPLVWGFVADALVDQTLTSDVLVMWLSIMLASYLIGIAAGAVQSYLLEKTGQAFVRDIRAELFSKFQEQSLAYHRNCRTGELVTRITSDVDAMEQSVLQGLTCIDGGVRHFYRGGGNGSLDQSGGWCGVYYPARLRFYFYPKIQS